MSQQSELELVNEIVMHLSLCTNATTRLARRLECGSDLTDASSVLTESSSTADMPSPAMALAPLGELLAPMHRPPAFAEPPVDPTGPHHLFVPGGLSLDGRVQAMYNNFIYDLPPSDAEGRLYVIIRGRRVGIFCTFRRISPHVNGVKCAIYNKISSVEEGIASLLEAIDRKEACWVP